MVSSLCQESEKMKEPQYKMVFKHKHDLHKTDIIYPKIVSIQTIASNKQILRKRNLRNRNSLTLVVELTIQNVYFFLSDLFLFVE